MLSYVAVPTASIRVEDYTSAGLSTHVSTVGDITLTNLDGDNNGDVGKCTHNYGRIVHQIYHNYTVSLCLYLY